jgi:hypothetical protein
MGWLEGGGLGAEGGGIVEPIKEIVRKDKTGGIGSGVPRSDSNTDSLSESYRQQLSDNYFTKINERDPNYHR